MVQWTKLMSSFHKLYEELNHKRDLWFSHPGEDVGEESLALIQRGLEIRSDRTDGNTFWDDYITVFGNNPDAASKLLGVSPDRIAKSIKQIKEALKKIRESNDQTDSTKKKRSEMLPTGY